MRLANPLYESMPAIYACIGAVGFVVSYLDPTGLRNGVALAIGIFAEISALTIFLRRRDSRERSREYSGGHIESPSS